MIDISKLSGRYQVRSMSDADADDILAFCLRNTQYYQYCGKQPSRELILSDLHVTPPGIGASSKYYVGFYDRDTLVAVMDLIDGYPDENTAFIGFFMMDAIRQGKGTGRKLVKGVLDHLREAGFSRVRLCINKGNPQSTHFWHRIGFKDIREAKRGEETVIIADYQLGEEDE